MTDYNELVDTARVRRAHTDFVALQQAERDAGTELEAAKAAARRAHAAAQAAADRGDGADELDAAEVLVDGAERRVRVAQRVLTAASGKRDAGARTRDDEIRQAHAVAMNAAMRRFIAIHAEASEAFSKLEDLKAEHRAVRAEFQHLAQAADAGIPNLISVYHELLAADGKLMSPDELRNRLSGNEWHEFDRVANKLRWTEG